jgi:hypothetical protein
MVCVSGAAAEHFRSNQFGLPQSPLFRELLGEHAATGWIEFSSKSAPRIRDNPVALDFYAHPNVMGTRLNSPCDLTVGRHADKVRPSLEVAESVAGTRFRIQQNNRIIGAHYSDNANSRPGLWLSTPNQLRLVCNTQLSALDPVSVIHRLCPANASVAAAAAS